MLRTSTLFSAWKLCVFAKYLPGVNTTVLNYLRHALQIWFMLLTTQLYWKQ